MGKTVVMGRKTWDSLPKKPLPERTNIVVTRQSGWTGEGAVAAHPWTMTLAKAAQAAEVMVIGGAEIYRAALAKAPAHRIDRSASRLRGRCGFRVRPRRLARNRRARIMSRRTGWPSVM